MYSESSYFVPLEVRAPPARGWLQTLSFPLPLLQEALSSAAQATRSHVLLEVSWPPGEGSVSRSSAQSPT